MNRSRVLLLGVLALAVLVLASCAAGPNNVARVDAPEIAGFWQGVWHGLILPITFIVSLFTDDVSIYDVHNDGNWYDFGFVLGLGILSSASAGPRVAARRSR
jgi:hypothetical protein